jgi:hypothetical protein
MRLVHPPHEAPKNSLCETRVQLVGDVQVLPRSKERRDPKWKAEMQAWKEGPLAPFFVAAEGRLTRPYGVQVIFESLAVALPEARQRAAGQSLRRIHWLEDDGVKLYRGAPRVIEKVIHGFEALIGQKLFLKSADEKILMLLLSSPWARFKLQLTQFSNQIEGGLSAWIERSGMVRSQDYAMKKMAEKLSQQAGVSGEVSDFLESLNWKKNELASGSISKALAERALQALQVIHREWCHKTGRGACKIPLTRLEILAWIDFLDKDH